MAQQRGGSSRAVLCANSLNSSIPDVRRQPRLHLLQQHVLSAAAALCYFHNLIFSGDIISFAFRRLVSLALLSYPQTMPQPATLSGCT